jgi:hypothetical protein
LSKGEKTNENPSKCNLRLKMKEGKTDTSDQPTKTENFSNVVAASNKEKDEKKTYALAKSVRVLTGI